MTDDVMRELVCRAIAMAMERIQQGKYHPPTPEELKIIEKRLSGKTIQKSQVLVKDK